MKRIDIARRSLAAAEAAKRWVFALAFLGLLTASTAKADYVSSLG